MPDRQVNKQVNNENLCKQLLIYLDIKQPTPTQLDKAEKLFLRVKIDQSMNFDPKLSKNEAVCLYLIANGYTAREIAKELHAKLSTVESCQKEIRRKLKCKTIAEAVHRGVRFGLITPWQFPM